MGALPAGERGAFGGVPPPLNPLSKPPNPPLLTASSEYPFIWRRAPLLPDRLAQLSIAVLFWAFPEYLEKSLCNIPRKATSLLEKFKKKTCPKPLLCSSFQALKQGRRQSTKLLRRILFSGAKGKFLRGRAGLFRPAPRATNAA